MTEGDIDRVVQSVRGFKHWRKVKDQKLRSVALGFTVAYLGMVISNFVAPSFVQDMNLVISPVIMGMNENIYAYNEPN